MRFFKTLSMLSLLLALCPLLANERSFEFASGESGVRLSNNDDYGFNLDISVNSYTLNELQTKGGLYEQILLEGFAPSNRIGEATLPMLSRIVAVPIGAAIKFRITNQEEIQIAAKDSGLRRQILPTQPPVSKSADYASLVFEKDHSFYARDAFSKNPLFWIEELGYLRGVRLFQFYYEPLRYNPVSGELKISTNTSIRVDFEHPDLAATEELLAKTASYEFETLYSKTIFNWNPNRATLVRNPTKILILCPPAYSSGMATYINFKRKQGYTVDLVSVGTNGTLANNATTIKNYLQNLWNNATTNNPAPTYLLIVGDHGTTGNNITSNTGQTNTSHITDLSYVRLNGTDYLPEMYYGRFSVSSTTELSNIVNKTLMFAQTSMPDLSYLGKTVMIAGVDANYASTHGNGAINYATTHYINSAHGITSNNYLYPASGSSASQIRTNAAEGRAYMNYTAHGGATSWADPSFTAAQMTALTNTNKPFVAVGNCCITNQFNNSSPCFGEAIIRAPNAGAAYIGGTNNTYWNEDYYWAVGYKTPQAAAHAYDPSKLGVFDAMFHAPTNTADWASTTGETVFMGNMAVQQSGSSLRNYYWEIYSIMGDPSLMPYYGVPAVNNVSFPSVIMMNQSSITVSAAPYTRVALSFDGELSSSGIVPASGSLVLSFSPFSSVGMADLVFSASGKITRQESIQILPATGAYLSVEALEYRDNNNNLPDYNESGTLRVTFKNTGSSTASNITATLSCNNPGINITDGSETIANLVAGGNVTRNSAFAFNIADNVVNGTEADFTIIMSSGSNNWEHTFCLSLNAPELSFAQNIVIHDANANNNGRLDPGESVSLSITLHNTGNAASPAGIASLSCTNTGISIGGSPLNFASIPAGASTSLYFDISASSSMSIGEIAQLVFNASAGAYSASKSEAISVGLIFEGFETGNFSAFPWVLEGSPAWTIDSNQRHSGSYSAKTGSIGHSSSTTLKINRVLTAPGTLSFWYKVSCEAGYDKLAFYIDGTLQVGFNGEVDWTQVFFPLAAGNRELKWVYQKDSSVSSGSDCAWIDDIIFPPSTNPSPFAAPQNLGGIPANRKISLSWSAPASGSPTSYKVFRAGNHIATVNSLSYEDNNLTNGTVYTYYVTALYAGGESDPSNFINVVAGVPLEFIIGNGTASTSSTSGAPINIYYKSLHGQSIYTAQELNAVGLVGPAEISALGFYIETAPDYVLPDFRLRMRHTTSSNVSSWQSAAGLQIYYDADYMPIEGGFDMISLDPPFVWNGVDNILVDTAFGLVQSWSTSGTVRYTESASGYRFVRNDNTPQHQYFSGGSVSNTKPNIKLHIIAPQIDGAHIEVNPGSLDFGEIAVGQEATLPFVVENQGNLSMNCRITTPAGYSVHPQRDLDFDPLAKNTVSFRVSANSQRNLILRFIPTAAIDYAATLVISNDSENDPELEMPLSGSGYIPAEIALQLEELSCLLGLNATDSQSFTISNTGGRNLEYSIQIQAAGMREGLSQTKAIDAKRNVNWLSVSPSSGSIAPGESATLSASFNSADLEPGIYTALIEVLSNAPAQPESQIPVQLEVYDDTNNAPVINLPPRFSFFANGSLEIDLAEYISDPDGDTLSINVQSPNNPNIYHQLQGMLLRFTAREDWIGSQNFAITASDGELSSFAILQIRVLPNLSAPVVDMYLVEAVPRLGWQPVPYAEYYEVYYAPSLDAEYSLLATTTQNYYEPAAGMEKAFFKVKALYDIED